MAPEQFEGKDATAASDIYALGIVIYEMVTGTYPFGADSALAAAVKRLTELPLAPRAHVPDLEPRWEQTILRCLEREPATRFTSAGQVSRALDGSTLPREITAPAEPYVQVRVAAAYQRARVLRGRLLLSVGGVGLALALLFTLFSGRALAVSSIAVVPFANDGSDPDTAYLSDGITEAIIDSLAQLPQPALKVIALNSMMRYRGRDIDAKAVGDELKVGAVVIGRIVQRSDQLSVSAELVNASDRSRMWGETYSVTLADLPNVQEEIAEKISERLRLRLNGEQKERLTKRYTVNVEAYRLYLKGRYFWNQYTEVGWTTAIGYSTRRSRSIPTTHWRGRGSRTRTTSCRVSSCSQRRRFRRRGRRPLRRWRSTKVSPKRTRLSASSRPSTDWDASGATKEFKRAIELNPNYATAHQWYGMHLFANAQFEAALVELNKAQELDPLSLFIAVTAVWPLRHLGQDDQAITQLEKIIEMFPGVPDLVAYLHDVRGEAYLQKGMYDDAIAELLNGFKTKALCGDDRETIEALRRAYDMSGINGYWQKQRELATRRYEQERDSSTIPRRFVSPFRLAELHARLGDDERAFALLRLSYESRDENLRWLKAESLSDGSPWQSLRSDPRFTELIRGVGLDG